MHEHQRPDRDKYINIDMAAVARLDARSQQQFQKASFHDIGKLKIEIKSLTVRLRDSSAKGETLLLSYYISSKYLRKLQSLILIQLI